MIVLDNAGTRALSLINTQNGAQAEVSFSDYTTSTGAYTRGVPTLTTISSGTTTSICATPSSGVIRDIDYVNIYNTYAGSQTFTVQITSGSGGPFILVVATLAQSESLNYTHGSGWCAMDANGNRKESTGTVLASLTVTGNATIGGTLGVTGATTLGGALIGAATQAVFNTVSTTVNFAGGATAALNMGNPAGTNTVSGATTFSQGMNGTLGGGTPAGVFATTGSFSSHVQIADGFNITWSAPYGAGVPAITALAGGTGIDFYPTGSSAGRVVRFNGSGVIVTGTQTVTGGATFITTSSALTDGAGAGAGTILNAPSAGNPTKWIGIDDNGTTRYIPAW